MDDSNTNTDLEMDRYLEGEMSPEEKLDFELKLHSDAGLAQSFETYKLAKQYIQIYGFEEAKAEMASLWEEAKRSTSRTKIISFKNPSIIFIISAAAIVALVFLFSFFRFQSGPNYNEVYNKLAAKEDTRIILIQAMGNSINYVEAAKAYRNGKYAHSISLLEKLPKSSFSNDTLAYLLGDAYLKTLQPDKAISVFQQILSTENITQTIKQRVEWNIALAHILNKDFTKAKEALIRIKKNKKHFFYRHAEDALEEIE